MRGMQGAIQHHFQATGENLQGYTAADGNPHFFTTAIVTPAACDPVVEIAISQVTSGLGGDWWVSDSLHPSSLVVLSQVYDWQASQDAIERTCLALIRTA